MCHRGGWLQNVVALRGALPLVTPHLLPAQTVAGLHRTEKSGGLSMENEAEGVHLPNRRHRSL
jgi:hypothetical protein